MAEHIRHIKEIRHNGNLTQTSEMLDERDSSLEHIHAQYNAVRIVWYIAGVLLTVLGLRFLLALLGANPVNVFANFIYTISTPFVAPFFGLFSYNLRYSVAHLEIYTLLAMVIYALIAWGIARLITINRPSDEAL